MLKLRVRLGNALDGLQKRTLDLRPVWNDVAQRIRTSIVRNFEVGGRPIRWKPSRRAERTGGRTLVDTGRLRDSIARARPRKSPSRLVIGTNVKYAAVHQFGARKGSFGGRLVTVKGHVRKTRRGPVWVSPHKRYLKIPWGDIPARPFMMLQKDDVNYIRRAVRNYIMSVKS